MDRAVDGVIGQHPEHRLEKGRELGLAHLAAAHGEVGVPDPAEPTHVAVDRHIVGRVRKHELGLDAIQQPRIRRRVSCIRAQETVRSKLPQVAPPGHSWTGHIRWDLVLAFAGPRSFGRFLENEINLGGVEAGQRCGLFSRSFV